jgi:hypothetical protein
VVLFCLKTYGLSDRTVEVANTEQGLLYLLHLFKFPEMQQALCSWNSVSLLVFVLDAETSRKEWLCGNVWYFFSFSR